MMLLFALLTCSVTSILNSCNLDCEYEYEFERLGWKTYAECTCPANCVAHQKLSLRSNGCGSGSSFERFLGNFGDETTSCCDEHDLCYARPGATQKQCDQDFWDCLPWDQDTLIYYALHYVGFYFYESAQRKQVGCAQQCAGTNTRTRYHAAQVNAPSSCASQTQSRTCNNGNWGGWSGNYAHASCTVRNTCATSFTGTCPSGTSPNTMIVINSMCASSECTIQECCVGGSATQVEKSCSTRGCDIIHTFSNWQGGSVNVYMRGDFSHDSEYADIYVNSVWRQKCQGGGDCSSSYWNCGTLDVPVGRFQIRVDASWGVNVCSEPMAVRMVANQQNSGRTSCSKDADCDVSDSYYCGSSNECVQFSFDYCKESECGLGDGDCDKDSDCREPLICGRDNFRDFHPLLPVSLGNADACTPPSTACSNLELITGTTVAPGNLATKNNLVGVCGSSCATSLGLSLWSVCGLSDGQIDGPGHGGAIEDSQQAGYDCWVQCKTPGSGRRLLELDY